MLNLGCHLTSSKGYEYMGRQALQINADTFQFFTRNPRGGKAKEIDHEDVKRFLEIAEANNFVKIVAHAPYTLNPCSAEQKTRDFAYMAMKDDLERMEFTPGNYYNFHPGSHVGQGIEKGIEMIYENFIETLSKLGVEQIPVEGDFDPSIHQAVQQVQSDELESGKIASTFQKGYKIGNKVIRFAMVAVVA